MFQTIKNRIHHVLVNEDGPTSVEYAVMLAVIILACIGAVLQTGEVQQALWFDTANSIGNSMNN